jgi:site-specific DNA recombinase
MPGCRAPSAADPGRNPHRTGAAWTLRTVAAILANPRYTGRQVWNRQRTDFDLADPANTTLGHRQVQRWNLPEGWVISKHPAHATLVSEADFIAAQDAAAPRGPAGPVVRPGNTYVREDQIVPHRSPSCSPALPGPPHAGTAA